MDPKTSAKSSQKKRKHPIEEGDNITSVRGQAKKLSLTKHFKGKLVVEFNAKGKIKGAFIRSEFSNWVGTLVKNVVPLAEYPNWTKVDKQIKDDVWDSVLEKFEADPKFKKKGLQQCGKIWRKFKNYCTKYFVIPYIDDPDLMNPPKIYPNVKKQDWEKFVKIRLSEEFQELSKIQLERRNLNKYNHRLSKLGYDGLVDKMIEAGIPIDEDDRSLLWRLARQDKSGEYADDATKEVVQKIEELKNKVEEGVLATEGKNDILTMALGTPEPSGRVRAGGQYTTPTMYFNLPNKRSKKYHEDLEVKLKEKEAQNEKLKILVLHVLKEQGETNSPATTELLSELLKQGPKLVNSLPLENVESNSAKSDNRHKVIGKSKQRKDGGQQKKGVTSVKLKSKNVQSKIDNGKSIVDSEKLKAKDGKDQDCRLALGSKDNIVAEGRVLARKGPEDTVHNMPLGESYMKVSINKALCGDAFLPVRNGDEHVFVKDAVNSFVAWPKELVILKSDEVEKRIPLPRGSIQYKIRKFVDCVDKIVKENAFIEVPMVGTLFHDEMEEVRVSKDELMDVCEKRMLNGSCIISYMRYLYATFGIARAKYAFGNPESFTIYTKDDEKARYIQKLAEEHGDRVLLIPFNTGGHWVLMVLDIPSMEVYWLDSLKDFRGPPDPAFKLLVNTAIKTSNMSKGKRKMNPNPNWNYVTCPQQQGGIVCGYYVLRFMRDLVEDPGPPIKKKVLEFSSKKSYTNEIDELRLEFIDFIQQFIE